MSIDASQVLEQSGTSQQESSTSSTNTATVAVQKVDPQVSSKLEVLARREQAALNAERAATARVKEIEARESRLKEFESLKENKPLDALRALGYDYDQITKAQLLDGEVPPEVKVKKLEEKLDSFTKSQEQKEQDQAQQAKAEAEAAEQKAVSNFKTDINQFLSDNSARYELIQYEGRQQLVFETIDEHYNRTIDPQTGIGKVMTKAEAADKVEAWLEKKYHESRNLKKVIALLGLRQEVSKDVVKPQIQNRQPPKTLTNQLSATSTTPRKSPITDEERIQKAIAYAKGLRSGA